MTNQQTNWPGNQPVPLDKCECASRLSRPGRLVHQAILRAFARTGQAPSRADLDQVASAPGIEPAAALAELNHADLIVLDPRGELLAAYPFSAAPTPHRLTMDSGVSSHAMCAIDALGVSAMLGQLVTVTSAQPGTGQQVTVKVDGDQATWEPPTAVVLAVATADCCAPSAQRTCGYVNFFTTNAAALAWAGDHPELSWALLDQPQALATAIAEFGPLLRDPEPTPPGELSCRRPGGLLGMELASIQLGVQAANREQLGVGAPLDQAARTRARIWSAARMVDSRWAITLSRPHFLGACCGR